jgi:hypothetical protein
MSLDVDLMVVQPVSVFSQNITHNLGKMADAVILKSGLTLYQCLWRPEEVGITHASCLAEYLDEGWNILLSDPEKYKRYNPENGWGDYEGLCNFVYKYRNACWDTPDAKLEISR